MRSALIFATALAAVPAAAQAESGNGDSTAPALVTPFGVSAAVGGGFTSFVRNDVRDFTRVGGAWQARLVFGTRYHWGFEASYSGSEQNVEALGLDDSAALRSH